MPPIRELIRQRRASRAKTLRKELKRLTKELIKSGAEKIILFGSACRGEFGLTSDLDLIVVMPSEKSFIERSRDMYLKLRPLAADILFYTPEEFYQLSQTNSFVKNAVKTGKIIYEKTTWGGRKSA
ncbi:MAG TPA: nucleotidyltransferase domain-containing protein [Candidatus Hypogeohydataceae bacterium YC41]